MKRPLIIIGSGGFAMEAISWVPDHYYIEAFYSNLGTQTNSDLFGVPIIRHLDAMRGREFLVAVGSPEQRWRLWGMAIEASLVPCSPIIHETAVIGMGSAIGDGSIVCPQAVVTSRVMTGPGLILNLGATLGHECVVGSFVTVSPGANVSGNVTLGDRCYIGTNAAIRERTVIGVDATVGMGSVVIKDVKQGTTVIGNPARQLNR